MLNEFYRIAFCEMIHATAGELENDLDVLMTEYNAARPRLGRTCFSKTPTQTFLDASAIAQEKPVGRPFTAHLEAPT